jgi:hypothetical protein
MNITYFLGAGASYNALPVINELPSRLNSFELVVKSLISNPRKLNKSIAERDRYVEMMKTLQKDIQDLQKDVLAHKTVDTLAKKYYVVTNHHHKLIQLKKVLIAYFLFEQIRNTNPLSYTLRDKRPDEGKGRQFKEFPDKRYDSFIATVISKIRGDLNLSPNFKVITWNYDVQFELAYERYLPTPANLIEVQKRLQTIPNDLFLNGKNPIDLDKFSITRLNGIAGITSLPKIKELVTNEEWQVDVSDLVCLLAELHCNEQNEDVPLFSFAWEEHSQLHSVHPKKELLLEAAKEVMAQTKILVVVGYSFPNFNRSVDKKLFNELKGVERVYVQDTNADEIAELLKSTFPFLNEVYGFEYGSKQGTAKIPVLPIYGVDQFFIPPEAEI